MGIVFTGRYGYGGEFQSGKWLDEEKFDRPIPKGIHFKNLLLQIAERSKKDAEDMIIKYYERALITDGEFAEAIQRLPTR